MSGNQSTQFNSARMNAERARRRLPVLRSMVALCCAGPTGTTCAANAPDLVFSCHIQGGGYAIKDPNGQTLLNGDGARFPEGPPTVIRIDLTRRRVIVTGAPLPHPATPHEPTLTGLDPVRFRWGAAQFDLLPAENNQHTVRGTSNSVIDGGPYAGERMDAFWTGSCVTIRQ